MYLLLMYFSIIHRKLLVSKSNYYIPYAVMRFTMSHINTNIFTKSLLDYLSISKFVLTRRCLCCRIRNCLNQKMGLLWTPQHHRGRKVEILQPRGLFLVQPFCFTGWNKNIRPPMHSTIAHVNRYYTTLHIKPYKF